MTPEKEGELLPKEISDTLQLSSWKTQNTPMGKFCHPGKELFGVWPAIVDCVLFQHNSKMLLFH